MAGLLSEVQDQINRAIKAGIAEGLREALTTIPQ